MGVCLSLCPTDRPRSPESRIPALEIDGKTDSSSGGSAKGNASKRDSAPLLEGRTLLSFHNLSLDSSSDSVDLEKDRLAALLQAAAPPAEPAPGGRTFQEVRPDLELKDLPSSDSGGN
jgi:hypothetical protein